MKLPVRVQQWAVKAVSPLLSSLAPAGWAWNWPVAGLSGDIYPGSWQQNETASRGTVASYWAVFSCVTLIAKDISKLPAVVMQRDVANGIFKPTQHRPVLRKPNHFQTRLEFFFCWLVSQLLQGNTYVLKQRDERGFVVKLYVLDPMRVTPLVADDGSVYYQLNCDHLANVKTSVTVPASEIIHDRMYTLYHPLIGVSPIFACGVGAIQGLAIQNNSEKFFQNMSRPSGLLTAPGAISNETAARLKEQWERNYSANNLGRVAVLGDNLKYEAMTISAQDAQLIEQLKMTGEMIAACYHVPGHKIGVGPAVTVNNTATLNQQYYDQCLQYLIEKLEQRLDEGLEIEEPFETWMDLNALLRMDPASRYDSHSKAIGGGWKSPNEARREEDLLPVAGGDTPYMQEQNYSLAALDRRDKKEEESGGVDVQASVMNGAQVTALQGLLAAVTAGELPPESARAAIAAAFPLLTTEQIDAMISPLKQFETEPVNEGKDGVGDDSTDDETSEEDDEGDAEKAAAETQALIDYLQRAFDVELAA